MASPAFVRLGPSSADKSREIDEAPAGPYSGPIELTCAQVPSEFGPGSPIWLWLGSDNNKGQATDWEKGIRAFAICDKNDKIPDTKNFELVLRDVYLLPRSVTKPELLQSSPETYARSLADAAIIGLDNYSSQVVQILSDEEFATIGAMIVDMMPEVRDDLIARIPAIAGIKLFVRPDEGNEDAEPPTVDTEEEVLPPYTTDLPDDDPVLALARQLINDDKFGGVLLQGPPGTGKSWYARQIAIKLTDGERLRMRQVQFHPSYQYEDFVEGYVPKGSTGFRLQDKHLLQMVDVARGTEKHVVIVIDEFSRTDPARVLGEAMTYMEGSLRGVKFSLPSGRLSDIPANLIFIATMNPDDRSVDEIDDAMDRRWAKIDLKPDPRKLREFLLANGASGPMIAAVMKFFLALQEHVAIGHAFFRTVKDPVSLQRLWETQLQYVVQKRFRFDADSKREIGALWTECLAAVSPRPAAVAAQPAAAQQPQQAEAVAAVPDEVQPAQGA